MKILIIEDEAPAARRLKKLLENLLPAAQIIEIIDSVENAVKWFSTQPAPDLAMFDIQLSDGLSFDIFKQVHVGCPVIFTTAYDEYALKAFKVNSIYYLLKPIDEEEQKAAILKYQTIYLQQKNLPALSVPSTQIEALLQSINSYKEKEHKSRFLIKIGEKYLSITTKEIAYFISEDKSVYIITNDKIRYPVEHSLDELEKILDSNTFFRLNRQYIAHFDSIFRLHTSFNGKIKVQLKPETKEDVIVSRDKASILKDWLDS